MWYCCLYVHRSRESLSHACGILKNILYSETQISCTLQRWSSHTLKHISPRDESVGVGVHRGIFLWDRTLLFIPLVEEVCWRSNGYLLLKHFLYSQQCKISMKFHLTSWKIYLKSLISPSFDELHCSPLVIMNPMEPMFQNFEF